MLLNKGVDHCEKQHPQNPLKGDILLGLPEAVGVGWGGIYKQHNTLIFAVSLYN